MSKGNKSTYYSLKETYYSSKKNVPVVKENMGSFSISAAVRGQSNIYDTWSKSRSTGPYCGVT